MAEKAKKQPRRIRKPETVREKAQATPKTTVKVGRLRRTVKKVATPLKSVHRVGKKEYYLPLPDNKPGNFLNKRRSVLPKYFKNAYIELKQVVWPSRKQTVQLTTAVFVFAIIFGVIISVTDYGLDRIFKRLLLQ